MAKTIIDLKETPPKAIPSLTKDAMLYFVKKYGTKEDKVWYVELCKSNIIKKTNNITKEVAEGFDISKIRKAFAQKFFPHLLEEKKTRTKTKTYMDLLEELIED